MTTSSNTITPQVGVEATLIWSGMGAVAAFMVVLSAGALGYDFADPSHRLLWGFVIVSVMAAMIGWRTTSHWGVSFGLHRAGIAFLAALLAALQVVGWMGIIFSWPILVIGLLLLIMHAFVGGALPSRAWLVIVHLVVAWGTWYLYMTHGPTS